jgi:hypothetical protein
MESMMVTTSVAFNTTMFSRWASTIVALAVVIIAVAAAIYFTEHKAIRMFIGVGAAFAFIALGMRIVLLFLGTG